MEFEWDEIKSDACFAERGFDFAYAMRAFADTNRTVTKDLRWEYGEDRFQLLGAIDARVFCDCVHGSACIDSNHFGSQGQ